ncbi:GNAT family N-acetyltransferase [Rhodobacteraceae bacterium F11138]|nr:GNAT family N-acetyltransferase [Rhodobacteraceae bacterium F11138]
MRTRYRLAERSDAVQLNAALKQLSDHLGDDHRAEAQDLERAGWAQNPVFRAMLAETDQLVGAALYMPIFSTRIGEPGTYVSDLWIAPDQRGRNLGVGLLRAVLQDAATVWGADYIKLDVDACNPNARRFYERLGFLPSTDQTSMILGQSGCAALKGAK